METTACLATKIARMKTLSDRIAWILENRTGPDGKLWQAKTLSREAGLSETVVGMLQRGDQTNSKIDTIESIARVVRVSPAWLAYGIGSPDADALGAAPRLRDLPDWGDLLAGAKARAQAMGRPVSDWAWDAVGMDAPTLTSSPTVIDICELGIFYHDHGWGRPGVAPADVRKLRVV